MEDNLLIYNFLATTSYKLGGKILNIELNRTSSMSDAGIIYKDPENDLKRSVAYDRLRNLQSACEDLVNINSMGIDAWLDILLKGVKA